MTTPTPNDTEERIKKDAEEYADLVERRLTTAHRVRQVSYNVGAKTERNKVIDEAIEEFFDETLYDGAAIKRILESLKIDE